MTPHALESRYLAAQAIALEAGSLAKRLREDPERLNVEMKGPQDFVTVADRAVEDLIARRLLAAFPEDTMLGEEGHALAADAGGGAVWIVDPIDGTANYVRNLPDWCVSIGLVVDGRPELGVIHVPPLDQLFAARRGQGAVGNGRPIRVSGRTTISGATIGLDYSFSTPSAIHRAHIEAVHAHGGEYRRNGSVAVSLTHVASGRLDGFVEMELNTWDVAAGIVLVQEAGGWTNDFLAKGGLTGKNLIVAAAPGIRDQLLAITDLERSAG
ncbi:MAG TPA: inositol monophosphatase family protein [Dongiaceae bacterium]|nr:inositol monophosphatase family protein [Dongiaceae bacterium]